MKIGIASPIELNVVSCLFSKEDQNSIKRIKGIGGTQSAQLALELHAKGHTVVLFTLSPCLPSKSVKSFYSKGIVLHIGGFSIGFKRVLSFQYSEICLLKKMILSDCPDIVHAHWTYEFALAAILCRLPYVITVRDWPPAILKITRKPYRFVRLLMAMLVFLLGKNFVANSFYLHKKLEFLGRKRLKFLPNGIQSNLFVVGKKSFDFNGKIRIITINNGAGSIKNSGVLLRAFSKLRKVYSNITLRMLGAGYEDGGQFFLWAKEKGLTDGVDFIGKVDFRLVLTELDKAHLLIHSALEESFGNTIIEAMARRVPIIAGKQSGAVPWVVGKAGMLVDVSNSDDIAAAVVAFFSNKKMFSYFSEKGYENAKRRFLLAKIADEYICYYREVLSEC